MLDTGLRAAEICSVRVGDLDFDYCRLAVKSKGGDWKHVEFSEITRNCLLDWLDWRAFYTAAHVKALFVGINGRTPGSPLTKDGLRPLFRRIAKKAGVKHFSPHAMRRSMTTLTLMAGAPTRHVQKQGRWRDLRLVDRYSQALPQRAIRPYLPTTNLDDLANDTLSGNQGEVKQ